MTPDQRARIPMPPCCQTCVHQVRYLRADGTRMVERHECDHPFGILPHPYCSWHKQRTPPAGGERTPA